MLRWHSTHISRVFGAGHLHCMAPLALMSIRCNKAINTECFVSCDPLHEYMSHPFYWNPNSWIEAWPLEDVVTHCHYWLDNSRVHYYWSWCIHWPQKNILLHPCQLLQICLVIDSDHCPVLEFMCSNLHWANDDKGARIRKRITRAMFWMFF